MKTFHNNYDFNMDTIDFLDFNLSEALFFDIETTGFSASHTKLYLIGCLYYNEETSSFKTIQWFLDNPDDEAQVISSFFHFMKKYKYLIHFNGDGFDIPYIKQKCQQFNIQDSFDGIESIDIYKIASKLKNVLKTENLKQKTLENFLGIVREDKFSGEELIKIYDGYLKNRDDTSLALLILHNLDDIKGLLNLLNIFCYRNLFNGSFDVSAINVDNKEAIIELNLPFNLPTRISAGNNTYYITAYNRVARIKISIYSSELKYYYPNYKDYYYLPQEDCSIHKSVAFYVDKNFRTQAKAANCYSKKTGRFLPQAGAIISPYFKIEYNDKTTYFELTDDFTDDDTRIKSYALHILSLALNGF